MPKISSPWTIFFVTREAVDQKRLEKLKKPLRSRA
jgi:hypothetical protein